jgi:hypothetical protein
MEVLSYKFLLNEWIKVRLREDMQLAEEHTVNKD